MAFEYQKIGQDKFVLFEPDVYSYEISDFSDTTNLKVFARSTKYETHKTEIVSSYFSYSDPSETGVLSIIFDLDFPVENYYSFKIIDVYDLASRKTSIGTLSDISVENLNSEFNNIIEILNKFQDIYNKRGYKLDSEEENNTLPELPASHFWAKDSNGDFTAVALSEILSSYPDPQELYELYGIDAGTLSFDNTDTGLTSVLVRNAIIEVLGNATSKLEKGTYTGSDAQALQDGINTNANNISSLDIAKLETGYASGGVLLGKTELYSYYQYLDSNGDWIKLKYDTTSPYTHDGSGSINSDYMEYVTGKATLDKVETLSGAILYNPSNTTGLASLSVLYNKLGVTIDSGVVTLPAGKYYIEAVARTDKGSRVSAWSTYLYARKPDDTNLAVSNHAGHNQTTTITRQTHTVNWYHDTSTKGTDFKLVVDSTTWTGGEEYGQVKIIKLA